jgi:hypothetical protein
MTRQSLVRRLSQVEKILAPPKERGVILLFEGPGSEHFPRPTDEEIRENKVLVIRFVETGPGRRVGLRDEAHHGEQTP